MKEGLLYALPEHVEGVTCPSSSFPSLSAHLVAMGTARQRQTLHQLPRRGLREQKGGLRARSLSGSFKKQLEVKTSTYLLLILHEFLKSSTTFKIKGFKKDLLLSHKILKHLLTIDFIWITQCVLYLLRGLCFGEFWTKTVMFADTDTPGFLHSIIAAHLRRKHTCFVAS